MLTTGELYREQGADTLPQRDRIHRRAISQLEKLGPQNHHRSASRGRLTDPHRLALCRRL
jgi:hypothetical protein